MIKLMNILLEAKQIGLIYHFTSLENLENILKTNILESTSLNPPEMKKLLPKYATQVVSTTRDKYFYKHPKIDNRSLNHGDNYIHCAIILDGNKLSNNYSAMAFDYVGFIDPDEEFQEAYKHNINLTGKEFYGDESETIFLGKRIERDKGIKPIIPYIIQVNIYLIASSIDEEYAEEIIKKLKRLNIKVKYIYD